MLNEKEGKYLVQLARKSIEYFTEKGSMMPIDPADVPFKKLAEDGACFVTLYKNKELRGCIGSLEITRPLVFDLIDNSVNAAFHDPRFFPIELPELKKVKIEVSVLSKPEKMEAKTEKELLDKLVPRKHGLTIRKGWARATFLPVVWEHIKGKKEFLSHLCMKAGLPKDEWKDAASMKFYTYEAQEFQEE